MGPKRKTGGKPSNTRASDSQTAPDPQEDFNTPDDDSTQEDPVITGTKKASPRPVVEPPAKSRGPAVEWEDLDPETQRKFARRLDRERKKAKRKRRAEESSSAEPDGGQTEGETSSSDESAGETRAKSRREPTFRGHKAIYAAKSQQEYLLWLNDLEMDHRVHPKHFATEDMKVYYALKTLKEGSEASRRARIDGNPITLDNCTWSKFKELMQDALGSEALRHQTNYNKWIHAKWRDNPTSTLSHLKSIESLLPGPIDPHLALYHYWQLAPVSLTTRVPYDISKSTREDLVRILDRITSDDKRGQLQRPERKDGEPRGHRSETPKGTRHKRNRKNTRGQSNSPPRDTPRNDRDKPSKNDRDKQLRKDQKTRRQEQGLCFSGCGEKWSPGHDCKNRSSGQPRNANATIVATTRVSQSPAEKDRQSGKGQAS